MRLTTPAAERFEAKYVVRSDGCWMWTAATNGNGYGKFMAADGRQVYAHRFAYEQAYGPIPEGLVIDHLCRNHGCVNPAHLDAVTHRQNLLRGEGPTAQKAAQRHCVNGHEFTLANTYRRPDNGVRACLLCRRHSARERWRSRRAA